MSSSINIQMVNHLLDGSMKFEKVIETKRSRRSGETKEQYKLVEPVKQKVTFDFTNVNLQTVIQNAIGNLVVTVQNGSIRRSMDSIDTSSNHVGDQWKSVKTNNMIVYVSQKKAGHVEVPISQRIAAMTADELASNMTEEQLRAALNALNAKRGVK